MDRTGRFLTGEESDPRFSSKLIPQQNPSIYRPKNKLKHKIKGKTRKGKKVKKKKHTNPALAPSKRCCDL